MITHLSPLPLGGDLDCNAIVIEGTVIDIVHGVVTMLIRALYKSAPFQGRVALSLSRNTSLATLAFIFQKPSPFLVAMFEGPRTSVASTTTYKRHRLDSLKPQALIANRFGGYSHCDSCALRSKRHLSMPFRELSHTNSAVTTASAVLEQSG